MRSLDQIISTARHQPPFSNGDEGYVWMANWCDRCLHPAEVAWRRYEGGKRKTAPSEFPGGCPLLQAALIGETPTEWMEQSERRLGDQYHCIEFRGPDDGGEPRPRPEPSGMDGLFPRPERRTRMLKQSDRIEAHA